MLQIGLWKVSVYKQPAHHNHRYNWSPKQNPNMAKALFLHVSEKGCRIFGVVYTGSIFLECLADKRTFPSIALILP